MSTGWIFPDDDAETEAPPDGIDPDDGMPAVAPRSGPLTGNPYIDPGTGGPRVPQIFHLDADMVEAFRRWSTAENRKMSPQMRVLLRDAIPDIYWPERAPS